MSKFNEKVTCPKCQTIYKIKDPERLRKIRCSECQYIFEVGINEIDIISEKISNQQSIISVNENAKSIEGFLKENKLSPQSNLSDSSQLISKGEERYVLGSEIARGGMGKILLTKDINLRRSIVTKILLKKNSKLATLRFIEEAQITGQLEHPNIPPVYDLGLTKENNLFFTMKQIKGDTLQQIINKLKENDPTTIHQYSFNNLVGIFIKICNALSFAHNKKVIHRDIKPENIMIGEYGEVLLMDWGLAKIIGTKEEYEELDAEKVSTVRSEDITTNTMEGTTAGTPAFMAPEQALGHVEKLDQTSDIYSLGATFFNALSLERPVKGKSTQDILQNAADGKIQDLDENIPPELKAITFKAMAFEQKDRYQSVKEMEHDLNNYLLGYSVSAKQDNTIDVIKKFYKRNKVISIISTSFLTIFIISLIVFIISLKSQRNSAIEQREIANAALLKAETAIKQFEKEKADRLADNRNSAPSFFAKAQIETQMYNTIEAEQLMDTAISFDPENQTYRIYRGCLAFANNKIKKSINDLSIIKGNPHQEIISKIVTFLQSSDIIELNEIQKSTLADYCNTLKFYDISQKLTSEFPKKLMIWNQKLSAAWGAENFTLTMEKDLNKGKDEATKLSFSTKNQNDKIDFSLLKGIPIQAFKFQNCQIANVSFMENMPVEDLTCINCPLLTDISGLKNIKLKSIHLENTKVKDLSPLSNSALEILILKNSPVTSLKPLLHLPIIGIELFEINLDDFKELKSFVVEKMSIRNCKINELDFININQLKIILLINCRIKDISILKDATLLDRVDLQDSLVTDISPLANKNLRVLNLINCRIENIELLLTLKKLELLAITPSSLPLEWEQIIFKMKDQIKQIGSEFSFKKLKPVSEFLNENKGINLKNPLP